MAGDAAAAIVLTSLVLGTVGYATYKMVQVREGAKTSIEVSRTNEELETIRVIVVNSDQEMAHILAQRNVNWNADAPSFRLLTDPKTCEVYMLVSAVSNELTMQEQARCRILMDREKN